jgi:hypothetical protein
MDKADALKYIETKGDSKFVVRTEEEDATFLTNHAKEVEEKTIGPKISELHSRYDSDIFAVTGLKKETTEKTYDFVKRVMAEFKTKAEKSSVLETEIADLKKQIINGTSDKKTLEDLAAVQKAYKELEDNKTKEITTLKTEHEKFRMKADILSARTGLVFKKNIPEAAINSLVDQVVNDLINVGVYQDNKLVFLENGVPKRNAHNALNPYTANDLLKERLKDVLDVGRKIDGGPDVNKELTKEFDTKTGKLTKIAMVIPDSVKSKEDLSRYLIEAKLLRGTEEYSLAYKEYSANLPMR